MWRGYTRAWIEREGLLVDVTADQFPGIETPVMVTRSLGWHAQFTSIGGDDRPARIDIDIFDEANQARLHSIYERIMSNIHDS